MNDDPSSSSLTPTQLRLVTLSACLAARASPLIRDALERAATEVTDVEVEEALLQSYLFLGYPTVLNAFKMWRELRGEAAEESPDPGDEPWAEWADRGATILGTVYGGQGDRLRSNVRRLHPDLERWMVVEGYGKVLGRSGLALVDRELCVVAILAVTGAIPQLYSHLRGTLNVGASIEQVRETLDEVREVASEEGWPEVENTWRSLLERRAASPPSAKG